MHIRLSWIGFLVLITGCSHQSGDGPPLKPIDISSINEPIPYYLPPSRSGNPDSYKVLGRRYRVMKDSQGYTARGLASWYGRKFHGKPTASGEPYDMFALTAAHKTLPIPCFAQVTNLHNGRSVVVKINDRGPFHQDRLIDLSYAAAVKLGIDKTGTAPVEIRVIDTVESLAQPMFLQLGAFSSKSNAEKLKQRLRSYELPPLKILQSHNQGKTLYLLRVGPLNSKAQIDSATQLLKQLNIQPIIVSKN
ncbi:MAG: hypothetical protein AXA67_00375 [Methylothermaceae bacteria B42]|nr:MAG: hypothetical protein AXA67_00375 [Methylothermaceae bacteria B42]HHJ38829.1 septal ring lytic transglycosylase RlpA family protein [Methylothermaceae bacterium]